MNIKKPKSRYMPGTAVAGSSGIKDFINKIILLSFFYLFSILIIMSGILHKPENIAGWASFRIILFILFLPLLTKYIIHLLVAPWYKIINRTIHKKYSENYFPMVSVIIPAWNEQVGIIQTIESVLRSSYKNFELIIVNDGSTDQTGQKVCSFIDNYNGNIIVRYFEKKNGGKSSALNLAIDKASGDIILTTDADCALDFYAIENMVKPFVRKSVMAVAGNVRIGNSRKIIGSIQKLEYLYGFYFKRADSLLNSVYIVGGAAAAYRREIFDILGYFDEEIITEDIEYSTRILNSGYRINYVADAIFYTEAPTDINGLIKQRLRWKYGRLKTFFKYRDLFFRADGDQSKFLSFVILPVAFYAEMLLLLEIIFLPLFYLYTFFSRDFIPLIFAIVFLSVVIFLQIITDTKKEEIRDVILWAPIAWVVFYFIDFIEYVSLIKSIGKILKNKTITWQRWNRTGVFES